MAKRNFIDRNGNPIDFDTVVLDEVALPREVFELLYKNEVATPMTMKRDIIIALYRHLDNKSLGDASKKFSYLDIDDVVEKDFKIVKQSEISFSP